MQTYILSFMAGVLSVLSPCIIPLVPVLISEVVRGGGKDTIIFFAGFMTIFIFIITLTAIFTAAVTHYLLYARIVSSSLLILMGYLLLTEWTPGVSFRVPLTENPFLKGLLTSLAWTPCYSPYLLGLMAYSAAGGAVIFSAVNMGLYTAGFWSALFMVYLAADITIRRVMAGTEYIRKFSGALIITAGVYMLYQLIIR